MSEYRPDKWLIVWINSENYPHYKVFGSFYGGYPEGDSWRMNSGITSVEETDLEYTFYGTTGSKYTCFKDAYGLNVYSASVLRGYEKQYPGVFIPLYDKPNVMDLKYLGEEQSG